jgi:HlyD family secretion protein
MPNKSSTQDRLSQNGHSLVGEASTLSPPAPPAPPASLADDWSSLTKELIDTLPRVWTRGLLYFLVVFAAIILPWAMLSKVDETGSARGQGERILIYTKHPTWYCGINTLTEKEISHSTLPNEAET